MPNINHKQDNKWSNVRHIKISRDTSRKKNLVHEIKIESWQGKVEEEKTRIYDLMATNYISPQSPHLPPSFSKPCQFHFIGNLVKLALLGPKMTDHQLELSLSPGHDADLPWTHSQHQCFSIYFLHFRAALPFCLTHILKGYQR